MLVLVFILAVFITYNAGYYCTAAFHQTSGVSLLGDDLGRSVNSDTLKACNDRTKHAQVGFFSSHACWFNISRRADWVATRLFFQSRAEAMKKGLTHPGSDDKCGFISIGTGQYDEQQMAMAAYKQDNDASTKLQLDDYVANMRAAAVFDQCYTFTYTLEKELPMAQQALSTIKSSLVRPLWKDADTTLDTEFSKITSSIVEGTIFVKAHIRAYESDLLAGFKTGLASGRVGGFIWQRSVTASEHVRSLKDEVDFVSSFGYAVYLASAEEAEMSQQFQRVYTPGGFVRLDRGLWDNTYAVPNADLVLTVVAVQQTHPFRSYLDSQQAMCPITVDKLGNAKCECVLENFGQAQDECSLAHLVTRNPTSAHGHAGGDWRQPLAVQQAELSSTPAAQQLPPQEIPVNAIPANSVY